MDNEYCEYVTNETKEFGLCNRDCPHWNQTGAIQVFKDGEVYNSCATYGKKTKNDFVAMLDSLLKMKSKVILEKLV